MKNPITWNMVRPRGSRGFRAAAVLAAAAAGLVIAAPQASAHTITNLTVAPGLGNGYGTGCSYQVSATVDSDAMRIAFLDNGWQIRSGNLQVSGDTASLTWTPSTPGTHVIKAQMVVADYESTSITVQVGTGVNLGSACLVQ